MLSITAALIVKNEAGNLPRCLTSLKGRVGEIVVMDTGSTDDTVAIAESFGARIGHFEWCEDFSAARNAALAMVQTEWFLSIDADDELHLDKGDDSLKRLASDMGNATQVLVPIYDAHRESVPQLGPRLFRMVEGLRWVRPIHEEVVVDEEPVIFDGTGYLHYKHHGYNPEANAAKIERNLRLLRAHLDKAPDDLKSLFYLARELAWAGRNQESLDAALELLDSGELEGWELSDAYAVAAWNALFLKDYQAACDYTREARRLGAATALTEHMRAMAFMYLGQRSKALEAASRACSMPAPKSLLGLHDILTTRRFDLLRTLQQG